jgi:hypothetical protein
MKKQFLLLFATFFLFVIVKGQRRDEWVTIQKGSSLKIVDTVKEGASAVAKLRINIPGLKTSVLVAGFQYNSIVQNLISRDVCVFINEDEIRVVSKCEQK